MCRGADMSQVNMHELAVCRALVRTVDETRRQRGAAAVRHVTVRIGPLAGVEPDLLRFAWDAATLDTPVAGATLEIQQAPLIVRCRACGATSAGQPADLRCRACHSSATVLESGDDCVLVGVDLLLPAPADLC